MGEGTSLLPLPRNNNKATCGGGPEAWTVKSRSENLISSHRKSPMQKKLECTPDFFLWIFFFFYSFPTWKEVKTIFLSV
jgi:hypothetical protein